MTTILGGCLRRRNAFTGSGLSRTPSWRAAQERSFSATRRQAANPIVDYVIIPPTWLMDTLHSTGMAWSGVLVTTAIIARGIISYHLIALPSRQHNIRNTCRTPLDSAKVIIRLREHARANGGVPRRMDVIKERIRSFPYRMFRPALAQMGFLVCVTEAIRVKIGSSSGLLSLLTGPLSSSFNSVANSTQSNPTTAPGNPPPLQTNPDLSPEELLAERIWTQNQLNTTSLEPSPLHNLTTLPSTPSTTLDPTLLTEGLPWCPDLTIPDPTLILPLSLSLSMALTIYARYARNTSSTVLHPVNTPSTTTAPLTNPSNPLATLPLAQRFGLAISFWFFFGAMHMPSALVLYLTANVIVSGVQAKWLAVRYPVVRGIGACRMPLRSRLRGRRRTVTGVEESWGP